MTPLCTFFVPGTPAPGGSKNPIPIPDAKGPYIRRRDGKPVRIVVVDAGGVANAKWKKTVATFGRMLYTGPVLDQPLRVNVSLYVSRPLKHFNKRKAGLFLRADAPAYPAVSPDVDKLGRSTIDALKGIVWRDDSLIIGGDRWKFYAPEEKCGAQIDVYAMPTPDGDKPGASVRVEVIG